MAEHVINPKKYGPQNKCGEREDCRQPFSGGSFFDHEGLPYCETHYHAKRGSLCAGCSKPITGRCITAMFKKFHPEHFVCAFCLKQLNKGTFKEQNDKPYCHQCFDKLFGRHSTFFPPEADQSRDHAALRCLIFPPHQEHPTFKPVGSEALRQHRVSGECRELHVAVWANYCHSQPFANPSAAQGQGKAAQRRSTTFDRRSNHRARQPNHVLVRASFAVPSTPSSSI
ncbi:transforming growth factor beta-1-induced transcript 1 protein-like [Uranotaenia lowii]|uniref:transforming growth factor beta-1-induced transcript 1 protein-like n=1 Tax=Uranotaenia lowii TaxID=190385 RepID=UPI00247879FD|nr:transforming growth factor beta-1-induced transcript 1 protein-like [Uranotaenia lowii]